MIVILMGEGKDRPSLSPISVACVYVLVYVYMLTLVYEPQSVKTSLNDTVDNISLITHT